MELPNLEKPIVIDANVLFYAICASSNEGPDNNSELDKRTRLKGVDPEKVRGDLILNLMSRPLVIPQVAIEELNSKKTQAMLSETNKRNLALINNVIEDIGWKHIPTKEDISFQQMTLRALQSRAVAQAEKVKKEGGQVPDHWSEPRNEWTQKQKDAVIDPAVFNHPVCKVYRKMKPDMSRAESAMKAVIGCISTPEIELLKGAKAKRELALADTTPIEEQNKLNDEATDMEMAAETARPYLINDFTIKAVTKSLERHGASLLTYDNDFKVINDIIPNQAIKLDARNQGAPATIKELVDAIKNNQKKFPKLPKQEIAGIN